jgi:hypothetical protein
MIVTEQVIVLGNGPVIIVNDGYEVWTSEESFEKVQTLFEALVIGSRVRMHISINDCEVCWARTHLYPLWHGDRDWFHAEVEGGTPLARRLIGIPSLSEVINEMLSRG